MNRTAILAELLTTPEGKTLEFQRDLSSFRPILKSLVAFANTAGGTLVIGRAMEIENPGMLPFGMTLDDLKAGVSRIRNRVIARMLREFGLLEEWGTGYRRITEDCRAGGYPAPEWEERGPALRVVFRPHPAAVAAADETIDVPVNVPVIVPVNERQRWFLDQIARGGAAKAAEIAAHFQVTEKTAQRDLTDLKAKQLIEFVGAPKTGVYRVKGPSS